MEKPKYQIIIDDIINRINSGKLSTGDKILSRNQMVEKYNVSADTVNRAVNILVKDGIISKTKGKGSFITDNFKDKYNTSKTIGIFIPSLVTNTDSHMIFETTASNMHPIITQGVIHAANDYGYNMQIYLPNKNKNTIDCLNELINRNIDGMIYFDEHTIPDKKKEECIRYIIKNKLPFIMIDTYLSKTSVSYICTDNFYGVYEMCKELEKRGFERILCISDTSSVSSIISRESGYKAYMKEKGQSGNITTLNVYDNMLFSENYINMDYIFCSVQKTAIIALNPVICRLFWEYALKNNYGISDIGWASFDKPLINYPDGVFHCDIIQDLQSISNMAVDEIIKLINKQKSIVQIEVEPNLRFYD